MLTGSHRDATNCFIPVITMLLLPAVTSILAAEPPAKPNVLYMVFDDFRPDLPFYGQPFVHAPNLWAFANRSLVFDRAYCQIAVCSPSRNSFMTGRRPNSTLVWNFFNSFREAQCPSASTNSQLEGPVIRSWNGRDPQMTGGAGGCCTSCTGEPSCVAWNYAGAAGAAGGECKLLSAITKEIPCPRGVDSKDNPIPCVSGKRGTFPKFTSMPEHFKNNGYLTLGVGKLYHDGGHGFGGNSTDHPEGNGTPPLADPLSWTNSTVQYPECEWNGTLCQCTGLPKFDNSYPGNKLQLGGAYLVPSGQGSCTGVPGGDTDFCTENVPDTGVGPDADGGIHGRPPMLDLPVFENAKVKLQYAAQNRNATGQPFFLAVGIKRPHLVWRVPAGYVDKYYNPANFTPPLPVSKVLDKSVDPIAWVPFFTHSPYVPLEDDRIRELRRHYYAAISWADYCAGQVLDSLNNVGMASSTVVLIHADHGWHLGEYNMWEKRTIWELGTRVPFMAHVPWLPQSHGQRTGAPTELVDVMPTLIDLAGLPTLTGDTLPLEGVSLRPVLENPSLPTLPSRDFALSTYARCPVLDGPTWNDACIHIVERSAFRFMGYTIRTTSYRYTEFVGWNGSTLSPQWDNVHSRELYNHTLDIPGEGLWERKDDFEDKNLVATADPDLVSELAKKLRAAFGGGGRPSLGVTE